MSKLLKFLIIPLFMGVLFTIPAKADNYLGDRDDRYMGRSERQWQDDGRGWFDRDGENQRHRDGWGSREGRQNWFGRDGDNRATRDGRGSRDGDWWHFNWNKDRRWDGDGRGEQRATDWMRGRDGGHEDRWGHERNFDGRAPERSNWDRMRNWWNDEERTMHTDGHRYSRMPRDERSQEFPPSYRR